MANEKKIPAVSIIVPMYNAEKYIGECLDSILAQTFKDYELLVVDDCSTDKSCEIVESYIQKFENRLQLIKSEKNSGGCPGTPRNIGIDIAHGEYIIFVDSDDVITPTALEELYPIAKKFDADFLQCQKYYRASDETVTTDKKNLTEVSEGWSEFIDKPFLESENFAKRVEDVGFHKIFLVPWNRLFRRDFIIKNKIKFPDFRTGSDFFFGFFALCLAKNLVYAPNVFYVWRQSQNSVSRGEMSPEKMLNKWTETTFYGFPILDKFMDRFDLFREHLEYRYLIFETVVHHHLRRIFPLYEDVPNTRLGGFMPSAKVDKIIREKINSLEDKNLLLRIFFNRMNFFQVQRINFKLKTIEQQEQIEKLQEKIKQLQTQLEDLKK